MDIFEMTNTSWKGSVETIRAASAVSDLFYGLLFEQCPMMDTCW